MENGQKNILIVDDEKDIVSVVKRGLEKAGYHVNAFTEPQQALDHFKPDFYNLAILDIRMPKMSGFELYRELKKKDDKLKVCFMTAFEIYYNEFHKMFPNVDVRRFIRKPVSLSELESIVKDELGQKGRCPS
jgi:DNA-binding NtrC family response regulator